MKKTVVALALLLIPAVAWAKGPVISINPDFTDAARNLSHLVGWMLGW